MKLPARNEIQDNIYGILLEVAGASGLLLLGLLICFWAAGVGAK